MEDSNKALFTIEKNSGELLIVSHSTFKGYNLVDVRTYFKDKLGELHATRKGCCFLPELWEQVVPEINKAIQQIRATTRE